MLNMSAICSQNMSAICSQNLCPIFMFNIPRIYVEYVSYLFLEFVPNFLGTPCPIFRGIHAQFFQYMADAGDHIWAAPPCMADAGDHIWAAPPCKSSCYTFSTELIFNRTHFQLNRIAHIHRHGSNSGTKHCGTNRQMVGITTQ